MKYCGVDVKEKAKDRGGIVKKKKEEKEREKGRNNSNTAVKIGGKVGR